MTARAAGREMAMGESREMTERNREKVLKYRGEEGLRVFEEKAEQFAVCPPLISSVTSLNLPLNHNHRPYQVPVIACNLTTREEKADR